MHIALLAGTVTTSFLAITLVILLVMFKPSRHAQRLSEVTRNPAELIHYKEPLSQKLLSLLSQLRLRVGLKENDKLKQRLIAAGLAGPSAADIYFAGRLLGLLGGILLGSLFSDNTFFWICVLAVVGFMAPDLLLTEVARRRRERIRRSMPDAIDLLVICVEAGLGLDQALLRSGQELRLSHREISQEFKQINLEQRAGKSRIEAWRGMENRTKLDQIKAFANMLSQTDRFGTPIVRALTTFSDSMRTKRRQQAEEMAAKTSVKLMFPLVLFIFPSIFIVLLGPAFISMARSFKGLFH